MTKDDIITKADRLLDRLEDTIDLPGKHLLYVQALKTVKVWKYIQQRLYIKKLRI